MAHRLTTILQQNKSFWPRGRKKSLPAEMMSKPAGGFFESTQTILLAIFQLSKALRPGVA
jgi:hypothetical protein